MPSVGEAKEYSIAFQGNKLGLSRQAYMHFYHGSVNARENFKMRVNECKLWSLADLTSTIRIRQKSQKGEGNDTTQEDEKLPCKVAV